MPPTKAMGVIKQNRPRPPHRNTMIDAGVLGCGPIRMGEGAAAPFNGVHIQGGIWPAGGLDTLAELQWADLIGPSIPAKKINHTTINRRGPLYVRRLAVRRNGGPVCGYGIKGNIRRLGGMKVMGNW